MSANQIDPAMAADGSTASNSIDNKNASAGTPGVAVSGMTPNMMTRAPMGTSSMTSAGMSAAMNGTAGDGMATGANAGAGAPSAVAGQGVAGSAGAGVTVAMTGACDRACLLQAMQTYLDALEAHDTAMLKVSSTLRVTDNGVAAKLGEGLFRTATMVLDDHRLDFADPVEGNVATHVVVNEGSTGVIYQARLKLVQGEITEIETMTVRRQGAANNFFNIENMKPEPVFLQEVPAGGRLTRDKLKEVTEMYLDYLEGKRTGSEVPFDEGCKRYENGQITAMGVSGFNAQSFWSFEVTRRILIIDEDAGITWGMFPFAQTENALVVGEAFKIFNDKIMMIQAVMANQPARTWD